MEAARQWRLAMRPVWPRPAFTLLPISPRRLAEKQASQDHFFQTVFKEGVLLATENSIPTIQQIGCSSQGRMWRRSVSWPGRNSVTPCAGFDYTAWAFAYPTLAPYINTAQATASFNQATLFQANDGSGPINDPVLALNLLNLLTAHLATLAYPTTGPLGSPDPASPEPVVGRISNATEGSVNVAAQNDYLDWARLSGINRPSGARCGGGSHGAVPHLSLSASLSSDWPLGPLGLRAGRRLRPLAGGPDGRQHHQADRGLLAARWRHQSLRRARRGLRQDRDRDHQRRDPGDGRVGCCARSSITVKCTFRSGWVSVIAADAYPKDDTFLMKPPIGFAQEPDFWASQSEYAQLERFTAKGAQMPGRSSRFRRVTTS